MYLYPFDSKKNMYLPHKLDCHHEQLGKSPASAITDERTSIIQPLTHKQQTNDSPCIEPMRLLLPPAATATALLFALHAKLTASFSPSVAAVVASCSSSSSATRPVASRCLRRVDASGNSALLSTSEDDDAAATLSIPSKRSQRKAAQRAKKQQQHRTDRCEATQGGPRRNPWFAWQFLSMFNTPFLISRLLLAPRHIKKHQSVRIQPPRSHFETATTPTTTQP